MPLQQHELREVEHWLTNMTRSLLLLKGANAADDENIISGGVYLGEPDHSENATPLEIYSDPKYLATAISSLLTMAQKSANYYPAKIGADKPTVDDYNRYVYAVSTCPFFNNIDSTQSSGKVSSKNYDALIDSITDVYKGALADKEIQKVTDSVTNMAKNVFSQSHAEQSEDLFSQVIISMDGTNDYKDSNVFTVASTHLAMKHDKSWKSEAASQEYSISRTTFKVLPEKIHAFAEQLAKKDTESVDDWLALMNTDDATNATPCIADDLKKAGQLKK